VQLRIVRTRTLNELAQDAARLPALLAEAELLRRETEAARAGAEAARSEAGRASARLEALTEETGRRLGSLIEATRDPATGPGIQGAVALQMVRDIIAEVKASGDEEAIEGVRIMDAILGEDSAFAGGGA
jgi:outer membrane murein-binding lipoprotein Lpp